MTAVYPSGLAAGQAGKARPAYAAALGAWLLRLIKEWHYRSEIQKLQGMSDRQLNDIGLNRSRIEQAVRGTAQDAGRSAGDPHSEPR